MSDRLLLVFVRSPRAGAVKTRLAAAVGDDVALELYRVLAEEAVRRTRPRDGEYARLFFHTPAEEQPLLEAWLPGERWVPQAEGELGERLARACDEAFRRGAARVVVIGSDAPWVGRETVLEALRALDAHDLVLGPAHDGGYYLAGLARPWPALFRGVAWSTPSVLAETLERARALGLRVRLLAPLPDIDTLADVGACWERLRPLLAGRPRLLAALERALPRTL